MFHISKITERTVYNYIYMYMYIVYLSIQEAKQLLEVIQNQYPAFFVDGRRCKLAVWHFGHLLCGTLSLFVVIVNYARQMNQPGGKSVSSSVASAAIEQAQWSMVSCSYKCIRKWSLSPEFKG